MAKLARTEIFLLLAASVFFVFVACDGGGGDKTDARLSADDDNDDASPDDDDDDDDDASPTDDDDNNDNDNDDDDDNDDESPEWIPMTSGTIDDLTAVWGSTASDVYAVSASGSILHYDGVQWHLTASEPDCVFSGVWGAASSDVYLAGDNRTGPSCLFHYDGISWSRISVPYDVIGDVWGVAWNDIYILYSNSCLHYDGVSWSYDTGCGHGNGIWGLTSSDIYKTQSDADGGTIYHYDGHTWTDMVPDFVSGIYPYSIWLASDADIWAALWGNDKYPYCLLHIANGDWEATASGMCDGPPTGIWGTSATDIFVVGKGGIALHYDGTNWRRMNTGSAATLNGVWGSSPSDVFAVGDHGTILHYGGPAS